MPEREIPQAEPARPRPGAAPAVAPAPRGAGGLFLVGIGASAGGLEACKRLLPGLPARAGMAFLVVQHMDPTHESLLVPLLGEATPMPVVEAADGMLLEPDHVYVIAPGYYLSVGGGALRLTPPRVRAGARLPFDFCLNSLAAAGPHAVCVVLSGNGTDGSAGLRAVKAAGGLVIAQAPEEAGHDGMPRSAMATGLVDLVLPAAEIGEALLTHSRLQGKPLSADGLAQIIELLRAQTPHDFTAYKPGTLERRILRRIGIAGLSPHDVEAYVTLLRRDRAELDALAADLLINVTSFFRDPAVFEQLASDIVPGLIAAAGTTPLRIWIAGCSTGEETYSLAILFQELIEASKSDVKLQIFASDIDAAAIAAAREGVYPAGIDQFVSAARLARFFRKDDNGYRISTDLRSQIVFAVHDVLADPPFSKLDFISCRNLLIYLRPAAQGKLISVFNFALRPNGILLLGSAETVVNPEGRFEIVSKTAKLYRKISAEGAAGLAVPMAGDVARAPARKISEPPAPRVTDIAEFTKRLVLATYAPAAILINQRLECLYLSGPTDRYLQVATGYPTLDLLAMIRPALRMRVKAAIDEALRDDVGVVIQGGRVVRDGVPLVFTIDVKPVVHLSERLLLICFVDQLDAPRQRRAAAAPADRTLIKELERELAATRRDLDAALTSVEASTQEQSAINEEALSINEEYQSTNEELLTSKEELQSLNEELTALNSQLQETLERSRMTSNDLQNVLFSTDMATLFLDTHLNIRFFTPATRALFTLIHSDIGRPLTDLQALSVDDALHDDALRVLENSLPIEREVRTRNGAWFNRRILPYRTHDNGVAGVVITFTDITERKNISGTLLVAQRSAEHANVAKSRFLAAASHDLRQPMQTLALINGLLAKAVETPAARALLRKLEDTTTAMTGILNTLLDINQLDAGIIQPDFVSYPINDMLLKIEREFADIAASRGLTLRHVPCGLFIRTDPRILEQVLRNLVSNALKYTNRGGVLLGCRRRGAKLSIEVWDTGLGIPQSELVAIFEEYHQLDNQGRQRSRGLGLGLSIVRRLAELLDHKVTVRSVHLKGSVFAIDADIAAPPAPAPEMVDQPAVERDRPVTGRVLVIEDDPDIRQLLEMFLREEGHEVAVAADGHAAIALIGAKTIAPDLILADYNLPSGDDGLEVATRLKRMLGRPVAVIIATGDISAETMRRVAATNCVQINKPMKLGDLNDMIQTSLRAALPPPVQNGAAAPTPHAGDEKLYVIDDDPDIGESMKAVFEPRGVPVEVFADSEDFLKAHDADRRGCVLVDAKLPGISGHELLALLPETFPKLRAIMITGAGDVNAAVLAMKSGAVDFVEKPMQYDELIACVDRVFEIARGRTESVMRREEAAALMASLTARQRQVMDMVLAGQASKIIAADLGISQRTVENHRAAIMAKTGTRSIPDLVRFALLAIRE